MDGAVLQALHQPFMVVTLTPIPRQCAALCEQHCGASANHTACHSCTVPCPMRITLIVHHPKSFSIRFRLLLLRLLLLLLALRRTRRRRRRRRQRRSRRWRRSRRRRRSRRLLLAELCRKDVEVAPRRLVLWLEADRRLEVRNCLLQPARYGVQRRSEVDMSGGVRRHQSERLLAACHGVVEPLASQHRPVWCTEVPVSGRPRVVVRMGVDGGAAWQGQIRGDQKARELSREQRRREDEERGGGKWSAGSCT